eukprot:CAMPEP_0197656734 /NCGR_PEP_ID=MMETSP1338-20131121/43138_1 /TAXON_ID=43686 ORGANISM="Pelagodinium beii, Strain RCC1491" /NCGR_SAMPLE_ID=MMETSP1338 /ASSEMBLY_ACC=CAM_ASM_000754 /LENGTH=199 /DNA_ID=CAMNT_0043232873 /DNA_START=17 /DNA_END=616 /DNA_ORIENTATION=+
MRAMVLRMLHPQPTAFSTSDSTEELARQTQPTASSTSDSTEEPARQILHRNPSRRNLEVLVDLPTTVLFGDISPPDTPRARVGQEHFSRRPRGHTIVLRMARPVAEGEELCSAWSTVSPKDCPICLEPLKSGELVQPMADCCHALHVDCAKRWLQVQQSAWGAKCPECRGPAMASRSLLPEGEGELAVPLSCLLSAEPG